MSPIRRSLEKKSEKRGCNTDDIQVIHGYLRETITALPDIISRSDPLDRSHIELVAKHLKVVGRALIDHHLNEDAVLWDLLSKRVPELEEAIGRMRRAHRETHELTEKMLSLAKQWREDPRDKEELVDVLHNLSEVVISHLNDEEKTIIPAASIHLTQGEWNRMVKLAIKKDWMHFIEVLKGMGYYLKNLPTNEAREEYMNSLPPIGRFLYKTLAEKKFEREYQELRKQ